MAIDLSLEKSETWPEVIVKSFERVMTETCAFADIGILILFDQLDEFLFSLSIDQLKFIPFFLQWNWIVLCNL